MGPVSVRVVAADAEHFTEAPRAVVSVHVDEELNAVRNLAADGRVRQLDAAISAEVTNRSKVSAAELACRVDSVPP